MKLQPIFSLGLALALVLLSGCGKIAKAEITTAAEIVVTTTEAIAVRSTVPAEKYPLGDGRTLVTPSYLEGDYEQIRIVLREESGAETILLEPEMRDQMNVPFVGIVLNDQYFTFGWCIPETCAANEGYVYDIQLRKAIDLGIDPNLYAYPEFKDGVLYYYDGWSKKGDEPVFEINLRDIAYKYQ